MFDHYFRTIWYPLILARTVRHDSPIPSNPLSSPTTNAKPLTLLPTLSISKRKSRQSPRNSDYDSSDMLSDGRSLTSEHMDWKLSRKPPCPPEVKPNLLSVFSAHLCEWPSPVQDCGIFLVRTERALDKYSDLCRYVPRMWGQRENQIKSQCIFSERSTETLFCPNHRTIAAPKSAWIGRATVRAGTVHRGLSRRGITTAVSAYA